MTTTSSNGWSWVLRDVSRQAGKGTKHRFDFDGTYTAACPGCGKDTLWNAFNGEPLCSCEGTP